MPVLNTRPKIDTDRVRTEVLKWDYGFWFNPELSAWHGIRERRREYQDKYRNINRKEDI